MNLQFKGTPGPWKTSAEMGIYSGKSVSVGNENGNLLCLLYAPEPEQIPANANLIAAAPELLECLDDANAIIGGLLTYALNHELDLGQHDFVVLKIEKYKAVIAKALKQQ